MAKAKTKALELSASSTLKGTENIHLTPVDKLISRMEIGEGSFGKVFQVEHVDWGDQLAYKLLLSGEVLERKELKETMKEVSNHHLLRHPNIVQMVSVVYTPEVELGILMWYEKYGSLFQFIHKFQVPLAWKINMSLQVILGLNYLHTIKPPIFHTDLKCDNVLVGEGYIAKISDFGLSRVKNYATMKTKRGSKVKGTLAYMAPEIKKGQAESSHASDVYSIGIMLWELFAGRRPFNDKVKMMNSAWRPDMTLLPDDLPEEMKSLMESCWSEKQEERPTSIDIKKKLQNLVSEHRQAIAEAKFALQDQERPSRRDAGAATSSSDVISLSAGTNKAIAVQSGAASSPVVNHQPTGYIRSNSAQPATPSAPEDSHRSHSAAAAAAVRSVENEARSNQRFYQTTTDSALVTDSISDHATNPYQTLPVQTGQHRQSVVEIGRNLQGVQLAADRLSQSDMGSTSTEQSGSSSLLVQLRSGSNNHPTQVSNRSVSADASINFSTGTSSSASMTSENTDTYSVALSHIPSTGSSVNVNEARRAFNSNTPSSVQHHTMPARLHSDPQRSRMSILPDNQGIRSSQDR